MIKKKFDQIMKKILYYKLLKKNAKVELPCGSPLHFRLEEMMHNSYLAVTDVWKEAGVRCYEGYICDRDFIQLKEEVFVYEDEFQDDKKCTQGDILKPYISYCMDEHWTPCKVLNINGKTFHFLPFYEWPGRWDVTYDLNVESAFKALKLSKTDKKLSFGKTFYYGIDGFGGLVALEPASETEDCLIDYDEQLEAAKLGCNIIYEYLK